MRSDLLRDRPMPRPVTELVRLFTQLGEKTPEQYVPEDRALFSEFREAINFGLVRCAERGPDGQWKVHTWFKKAVLAGFRLGQLLEIEGWVPRVNYFDKQTVPLRSFNLADKVRNVARWQCRMAEVLSRKSPSRMSCWCMVRSFPLMPSM